MPDGSATAHLYRSKIATVLMEGYSTESLHKDLVAVCWQMAERTEFLRLLRNWRTASVLLSTFALTVVRDLSSGVVVGCALAALLAAARCGIPSEGDAAPP